MTKIRSYREFRRLETFEERFRYLELKGVVGERTFGSERYLNQQFYRSAQWKAIRNEVIIRDNACDLGVEGYDINGKILIHHMNPVRVEDLLGDDDSILNPEYLVSVTLRTHNAIHYGYHPEAPRVYKERTPGDTKSW